MSYQLKSIHSPRPWVLTCAWHKNRRECGRVTRGLLPKVAQRLFRTFLTPQIIPSRTKELLPTLLPSLPTCFPFSSGLITVLSPQARAPGRFYSSTAPHLLSNSATFYQLCHHSYVSGIYHGIRLEPFPCLEELCPTAVPDGKLAGSSSLSTPLLDPPRFLPYHGVTCLNERTLHHALKLTTIP